jgi:hypothetical protein
LAISTASSFSGSLLLTAVAVRGLLSTIHAIEAAVQAYAIATVTNAAPHYPKALSVDAPNGSFYTIPAASYLRN